MGGERVGSASSFLVSSRLSGVVRDDADGGAVPPHEAAYFSSCLPTQAAQQEDTTPESYLLSVHHPVGAPRSLPRPLV